MLRIDLGLAGGSTIPTSDAVSLDLVFEIIVFSSVCLCMGHASIPSSLTTLMTVERLAHLKGRSIHFSIPNQLAFAPVILIRDSCFDLSSL